MSSQGVPGVDSANEHPLRSPRPNTATMTPQHASRLSIQAHFSGFTTVVHPLTCCPCSAVSQPCVHCRRSVLPSFEPDNITLDLLLAEGRRLAGEQEAVNQLKLSEEYMRDTGGGGASLIGLQG